MNTKNNQRTRLSKMLLKNALMDLLKENGSVEKISVRELCSVAELNRSTFYAHYNEPKDLLNEIENELLDSTEQHLERIGQEDDMGAHRYILSFLKYIKSNDKQFRTLLIDSADPEFRSKFMQQSIITLPHLRQIFRLSQEALCWQIQAATIMREQLTLHVQW